MARQGSDGHESFAADRATARAQSVATAPRRALGAGRRGRRARRAEEREGRASRRADGADESTNDAELANAMAEQAVVEIDYEAAAAVAATKASSTVPQSARTGRAPVRRRRARRAGAEASRLR